MQQQLELVDDGLPWYGERVGDSSHGTWGRHECGSRHKLRIRTVDCPTCGPDASSRTNAAKADNPYLLYLVGFGELRKFGVGDDRRLRAHRRAGPRLL